MIEEVAWHERYVSRMVANGVDRESAKEALQAGIGGYDYAYSPEDAADDEMSYWSD